MHAKLSKNAPEGLLLIDKPAGLTSHDVVDEVRRRFHIRQVGHGGTLDPQATGLLILLVGKATRRAQAFLGADKVYTATLRLGIVTDTQDREGKVLAEKPFDAVRPEQIEEVCSRFQGEIEQEVPAYSATRIHGKRSYELARAGIAVPRRIRRIAIHELKILRVYSPDIDLYIRCSKGTYVRTLCADIGAALGCGGILAQLRRVQVGSFHIDQAVRLEEAGAQHVLPLA